jgi:hypothetical protein
VRLCRLGPATVRLAFHCGHHPALPRTAAVGQNRSSAGYSVTSSARVSSVWGTVRPRPARSVSGQPGKTHSEQFSTAAPLTEFNYVRRETLAVSFVLVRADDETAATRTERLDSSAQSSEAEMTGKTMSDKPR